MVDQPGEATSVAASAPRDSIPALTGLRAIAAWLVWLRHTELMPNQPVFFTRLTYEGSVGVSVFFVLSGFLIALRYFDEVRIERSWFGGYMKNRFARIYPVYFAITLVSLVVYHSPAFEWFTSLTLLGGFVYPGLLVVGPAWSIVVEECFYLTAPFLFLAMRRGFLMGFVLPLGLALAIATVVAVAGWPSFDVFWFLVRRSYLGHLMEFLLGSWAALLVLRGKLRARSGLWTYGGIVAFLGGILVLVFRQDPGMIAYRSQGAVLSNAFGNLVLPWAAATLIVGLALETTWVSRFLSHPVLVLCGRASYVFYLIHFGVVAGLLAKYLHLKYVFQFVAMNLISIAIFWFYEEPLRNWIRGHRRNRRARLANA